MTEYLSFLSLFLKTLIFSQEPRPLKERSNLPKASLPAELVLRSPHCLLSRTMGLTNRRAEKIAKQQTWKKHMNRYSEARAKGRAFQGAIEAQAKAQETAWGIPPQEDRASLARRHTTAADPTARTPPPRSRQLQKPNRPPAKQWGRGEAEGGPRVWPQKQEKQACWKILQEKHNKETFEARNSPIFLSIPFQMSKTWKGNQKF